ncbi:MAG TPA: S41 family peptidase [Pyrinomonadaceae bacterium]|nr:S41 family peptidase [Pyrinomonadaceae bacterium]
MKNNLSTTNRARLVLGYATILVLAVIAMSTVSVSAQKMDVVERGRAKAMLDTIKSVIKKNYYDPQFHGMDLDARFKAAAEKVDQAQTIGQADGIIAQTLMDLNDSHTFFMPPSKNVKVEYGWTMLMIGSKCFVTAVKPKSDAEAKGLKPGDEILSVEGFRPNRKEMWKVNYYYNVISPRSMVRLAVLSPGAKEPRQLEIATKVTTLKRVVDLTSDMDVSTFMREQDDDSTAEFHHFRTIGGVAIWRMPSFSFDPKDVDEIMRGRIAKSRDLIIDLRGNGGGYVVTLEQLAGYFFEKDTKIAELKARKPEKPLMAKSQGEKGYKGRLVVLIDSNSGSASEILARLMQIEKRGVVLGDQSSGSVMQSRVFRQSTGNENLRFYAVSVTGADVIMTDGQSLEHAGVAPNEKIIPTGEDLAARRDPVLARALELLGQNVPPEAAGKLFPVKWEK